METLLWPWMAERHPALTSSATFHQTFFLRVWTLYYFPLAAFLAWLAGKALLPLDGSRDKLILLIIVGSALLRISSPGIALNSVPGPDGIHYSLLASRMASGGSFMLQAGPGEVPSRYSPGPSLMMLPTQWMNPSGFGWGIFSITLYSWLSILLVYKLGRLVFGHATGLYAALFLSLSPMHGYYSRQLMGEIPWSLFILGSAFLMVKYRRRMAGTFAGGLVMGLGMLFKPPHLGFVAGALFAVFGFHALRWIQGHGRREWGLPCLYLAGVLIGMVPLFAYQEFVLGDWFRTGYHVYRTAGQHLVETFSAEFLFGKPNAGGSIGNIPYYLMAFAGLEPRPERLPFLFPLGLLLAAFALKYRGNLRQMTEEKLFFLLFAIPVTFSYGAVFLFYAFQDPRFFLPILPFWILLLARPATGIMDEDRMKTPVQAALLCSLAAVLALMAGILHVEQPGFRQPVGERLGALARSARNYDFLVTDEDPLLLTHFGVWTENTAVLPLIAPGSPWFSDRPLHQLETEGVILEPTGDVLDAIRARLRAQQRGGLWLRFPARHKELIEKIKVQVEVAPEDAAGLRPLSLRASAPPARPSVTADGRNPD